MTAATYAPVTGAIGLEVVGMSKAFGPLVALDDVSIRVKAGSFHALLGENGAGKSTLVKCVMGFHRPDRGKVLVDGRELAITSPRTALAARIGMVYQHSSLVPSLTAAENLVLSRDDAPVVIHWDRERARLVEFLEHMPFRVPLDARVSTLAAGERQKLEILKQLFLGQRFLILDEPTSILTPGEADEILGLMREHDHARRDHGSDDHAQVPRSACVRRGGDRAATGSACRIGAGFHTVQRRPGDADDRSCPAGSAISTRRSAADTRPLRAA